jgi:RNA polymerase sigma-70 factor (ECF subfamily)
MSSNLPSGATPASPEHRFLDYARTGNKAVIQALLAEFADRSYTQARRIIGRRDGAEDAVQDAYVRLVNSAKKYDGSVPFAAWLGRLVNLSALNHRERRLSRHTNFSDMRDLGAFAMDNQTTDPDSADMPEIEALRSALDSLPDRYRAAMTMHYFSGLDRNETAQALGIPTITLAKQLERGLERLRDKLGRAGFAITSAGLLTVMASLPTYAAPPTLRASIGAAASERLAAAVLQVKQAASVATGVGIATVVVVVVLAVAATMMLSRPGKAPAPTSGAPVQTIGMGLEHGLIGHWTFDETGGMTAADSSGNGFDGRLHQDTTTNWIAGKIAGALDFDGVGGAVFVDSPAALNDLTRFTIAAWIMPRSFGQFESTSQLNLGRIMNKRNRNPAGMSAGWATGWSLLISNHEPEGTAGTFRFRQTFSLAEGVWAAPDNSTTLGAWQHVALTYDNSSVANVPTFYLNGVRVATVVGTQPSGSVSPDAASALVLGNADIPVRSFDGAIDDVRIYNRILDASEIQALVDHVSTSRK